MNSVNRGANNSLARDYLLRSFILQAALGVERAYQYSWNHGYMGVTEPDTGAEKPVAEAFRTAARWLTGAIQVQCRQLADQFRCEIQRQGKRSLVLWRATETENRITVENPGYATVEGIDGVQSPAKATVDLGRSPILLHSD